MLEFRHDEAVDWRRDSFSLDHRRSRIANRLKRPMPSWIGCAKLKGERQNNCGNGQTARELHFRGSGVGLISNGNSTVFFSSDFGIGRNTSTSNGRPMRLAARSSRIV